MSLYRLDVNEGVSSRAFRDPTCQAMLSISAAVLVRSKSPSYVLLCHLASFGDILNENHVLQHLGVPDLRRLKIRAPRPVPVGQLGHDFGQVYLRNPIRISTIEILTRPFAHFCQTSHFNSGGGVQ